MSLFKQSGLTLLELLIAMMVMAILTGIGFSGWQWIQHEQLRSETQTLMNQLHALRQLAIATHQDWQICPDNGQASCQSPGDDWSAGYRWSPASGTANRTSGSHVVEGVHLEWNAGKTITFSWRPANKQHSFGTFTLCNATGGNEIVINDAGRVHLKQGTASSC